MDLLGGHVCGTRSWVGVREGPLGMGLGGHEKPWQPSFPLEQPCRLSDGQSLVIRWRPRRCSLQTWVKTRSLKALNSV